MHCGSIGRFGDPEASVGRFGDPELASNALWVFFLRNNLNKFSHNYQGGVYGPQSGDGSNHPVSAKNSPIWGVSDPGCNR